MKYEEKFFERAFLEAEKALSIGEVPVGVVIVKNGKIISTAHNEKEKKKCALYHAELLAIKKATKKIHNWRLNDCDIYVTLEPCEMCASAIKQSRITNIYSALSNDDKNIHKNVLNILKSDKANPQVNLYNDLFSAKEVELLKSFFNSQRNN